MYRVLTNHSHGSEVHSTLFENMYDSVVRLTGKPWKFWHVEFYQKCCEGNEEEEISLKGKTVILMIDGEMGFQLGMLPYNHTIFRLI